VGQGQEHGAHRIDGPPQRIAALDRTREERAGKEHGGERESERADGPGEQHDPEGRGEKDRRRRPGAPSGHAAPEAVHGDRGDEGGDDGWESDPDLGVVPGDDGAQERHVPRPRRVLRERTVDDVGERSARCGDRCGLVRVERAVTERDEAEHECQPRAEVGQHPVEHRRGTRIHGYRLAGRRRGVGRGAHPDRG
jgi:hypothetical protein